MCTWTITTLVQIYFGNCIIRSALHVGRAGKIVRIYQKQLLQAKLKRKGDCVFRRDGPLLCLKWREKKDVLMLSTIHEAILWKQGG